MIIEPITTQERFSEASKLIQQEHSRYYQKHGVSVQAWQKTYATLAALTSLPLLLGAYSSEGTLMGVCGFKESAEDKATELCSLYVSSNHRGKGVAQALSREVLSRIAGPVVWHVHDKNQVMVDWMRREGRVFVREYEGVKISARFLVFKDERQQ